LRSRGLIALSALLPWMWIGPSLAQTSPDDLLVGAIRWDNWTPDSAHAAVVLDKAAEDRIPFFALTDAHGESRLLGGSGPVAQAENVYARAAGIDYWLFNYYAPTASFGRTLAFANRMNRALDAYRELSDRGGMRFALLLQQSYPIRDMATLVRLIGAMVADKDYIHLADGSAPLFAQGMRGWEETLGRPAAVRTFFGTLKNELARTSGRRVRLVLVGSDIARLDAYTGPGQPFDVFTSYVDAPPNDGRMRTMAECQTASRDFWKRAAATGKPFMPNAMLGWDMRVTLSHPDQLYDRSKTPGTCAPATDKEWLDYIRDARRAALRAGRGGPMPGLLFYAWNELSEGGWIVPTRRDGTRRLTVIAQALGRTSTTPRSVTLTYPDDGDPATHLDEWPCPPGLAASREQTVLADTEMRTLHPGRWTRRTCTRSLE
jgi:hypothetical protein